jgi:hypothetical protein
MKTFRQDRRSGAVLWGLLLLACASPASAVTIFERGKAEPTRGRLLRQSAGQVTIQEALPEGTTRERTILRSEIEDLIDPVSSERLAGLSPEQPQAYRNYAEELAEKRIDPDAQAAAIRLYLIAAWLDPEGMAKSSLLGMTALARSPDEEREFRAMAYLYDPDHDRRLLRAAEPKEAAANPTETRDYLLRALKLRRQGNGPGASTNLNRSGVKEELKKYSDYLTFEELSQAGLPDALLRKIVALELFLESGDRAAEGAPAWSQIYRPGMPPVPALRLETLTEFDPRLCVYRDGKWVAP